MKTVKVTINVNNEKIKLQVKPYETLLETLRERLALTGAKEACSLGSCGSCTVLLNGTPVRSCLILTPEVDGASITTIEGLKEDGKLHPLQEAFMEKGAVQCGFCTSGMIMTAKGLLNRNKKPSRAEIIKSISSNICRCTGYKKIVEAVEEASKKMA
ncbi:MAG TPA: (2Fe-2S)-binding protein [Syntrophorhabdaceae bacterium]|nr:(2Fe-2S)-binding protein [Syntrophorhabdaceae bacterium]HOL05964.1 (2Fe-2S)-binding protein [Syntrophorhabdaceae bacterium]HON84957.1 (2Fe-2S)-binding protein [Syntrophorhabdaceae bacterium]HOT41705.1 (2Fe-2S)-binding protein [Syntrophorhabdaceae bacterium]HPC66604.1 (2Fe-2S)-binding protein [Syntrophorhabdaceae bacterium]